MTLHDYLTSLSATQRDQFSEKLATLERASAIGYQAVFNLKAETRLPVDAWKDLVEGLLNAPDDAGEIKKTITAVMRRHVLDDRELPAPLPSLLGRAVTFDRFCSFLVDKDYYPREARAQMAVRRLLGKASGVVRRQWQNRDLGEHLMWCTFDPSLGPVGPFEAMPAQADEVRARLGLPGEDVGDELLLFEYELPADATLRYPSVAEAYAGEDWNQHFRPSSAGMQYGLTMPWASHSAEPPRPEAVHEVITGANVTAPLRLLT